MPKPEGIYPKYIVFKHPDFIPTGISGWVSTGGETPLPEPLEMVEQFVFVLKPGTDRHARVAIAAYAQSVMKDKPQLGKELMEILSDGS